MLKSLLGRAGRRADAAANIAALYGMIVAQARSPSFYRHFGVDDTVNGRFEMVVLHLWLTLRRLGQADAAGLTLGQGLIDRFCEDMDGHLRELGTGDFKVPKEMRRIGEAFYGRATAYDAAAAEAGNDALVQALVRNIGQPVDGAARMAAYIRVALDNMQHQDVASFTGGHVGFPDPDNC